MVEKFIFIFFFIFVGFLVLSMILYWLMVFVEVIMGFYFMYIWELFCIVIFFRIGILSGMWVGMDIDLTVLLVLSVLVLIII